MRISAALFVLGGLVFSASLVGCGGPGNKEAGREPTVAIATSEPAASAAPSSDASGSGTGEAPSATPAPPNAPRTAAQVAALHLTTGQLSLIGYVVSVYKCPPCPPQAMCKPCIGDHVVVSDSPAPVNGLGNMGPSDVVVFTERRQMDALAVGKRYRFDVKLGPGKMISKTLNDLLLIAATAAPAQ